MAVNKLFNLIAITALALFASSLGPSPVNALSSRAQHLNRHIAHEAIATKRKRDNSRRCKPRPSSPVSVSVAVSESTPKSSPNSVPVSSKAAAPQKSPSPPPPPPPPSNNNGGHSGKVGLAWPNGNEDSLKNFATEHVRSLYTWSPFCPPNTYGLECWPMLWGHKQINDFNANVKGGPGTILGFNEPNEPGQSNMSPDDACKLWKQEIQPKAQQGWKLITPATSSNPNGLVWVQNFIKCCDGCTFDGVGVHWYDTHAQGFIDYINLWHDTFNMDVYVTEYAVQNFNGGAQATMDQIFAFHRQVGPYMNSQPWLAVYMPFGFMRDMSGVNELNRLMNDDGTPTALGSMIINNAY